MGAQRKQCVNKYIYHTIKILSLPSLLDSKLSLRTVGNTVHEREKAKLLQTSLGLKLPSIIH